MSILHGYINYRVTDVKKEKDYLSELQTKALSGDLEAFNECLKYAREFGYSVGLGRLY